MASALPTKLTAKTPYEDMVLFEDGRFAKFSRDEYQAICKRFQVRPRAQAPRARGQDGSPRHAPTHAPDVAGDTAIRRGRQQHSRLVRGPAHDGERRRDQDVHRYGRPRAAEPSRRLRAKRTDPPPPRRRRPPPPRGTPAPELKAMIAENDKEKNGTYVTRSRGFIRGREAG